jgi:type III secretion protein L
VSKKLFSLIHDKKIHIAPKTKIIPADIISSVLEAQKVTEMVKDDAHHYRKEVMEECEKIKEKADKEGFEYGFSQWLSKIAELEEEIKRVRKDSEKMIIPIALKAARKIIGRELETSHTTIVDIITTSLKAVAQHKKVTIYVNRKEFEVIEKQREKIKGVFENLEALSIRPGEEVKEGGCIIETEAGIINAQLENQWMILENAFQKLMSPKLPKEAAREETR